MFDVTLKKKLGDFSLDAAFKSDTPVTALCGPSGAGKTTVVSAIAGLIRPNSGKVMIAGERLFDSEDSLEVPVHRRNVRVVFQESRLFPHLNVKQNLLYGRWLAGKNALPTLNEVVRLLALENLLSRRPRTLSGGERQRVAIGRALLADPRALLLDEPLASLDQTRKQEIFPYLEKLIRAAKIPILYVSHARDEIERLANTIVVLDEGHVKSVEKIRG
jgi:molybdate transport system ATP-binding protein